MYVCIFKYLNKQNVCKLDGPNLSPDVPRCNIAQQQKKRVAIRRACLRRDGIQKGP